MAIVPCQVSPAGKNYAGTLTGFEKISAPGLEMRIAPDGCVTFMKFPGPSESFRHLPGFLKTAVGLPRETSIGGSRGAFFFQDGPLSLANIRVDGTAAVVASGVIVAATSTDSSWGVSWTAS